MLLVRELCDQNLDLFVTRMMSDAIEKQKFKAPAALYYPFNFTFLTLIYIFVLILHPLLVRTFLYITHDVDLFYYIYLITMYSVGYYSHFVLKQLIALLLLNFTTTVCSAKQSELRNTQALTYLQNPSYFSNII